MRIAKRTLATIGMAALVLLAGVWAVGDAADPARAQVDAGEVYQQYVDAVNRGDVNGVMQLYADDAVVGGVPGCLPQDCVGQDAIRNVMEFYVAENLRVTITGLEGSGDTATGSIEAESDFIRAAGVTRITGSVSVETAGHKISIYRFAADFSDGQTADFVGYLVSNSITVALGRGRDADQSPGTAVLTTFGDRTPVDITITPGPAGVRQPAHVHEGTCADLGAVAFSLQGVAGGKSASALDVALTDLQTGNRAIAIEKSEGEPDVFVACGDIPAAAAPEAPPVEPAPAPEEAPAIAPAPVASPPATGTGGLLASGAGLGAVWWYALALVASGALLVIAGLAGLRRGRRHR